MDNMTRKGITDAYNRSSWFIVPGPVGSLRATTLMPTSVVLDWNPPQYYDGFIEHYDVEVLGIGFEQTSSGSSRKRKQIESGLTACYQNLNIS